MKLKVSNGNSKMGSISSVSLPAIITCRECDCHTKCYARKIEKLRPVVHNAYKSNLELLNNEPEVFWRELEASIMTSRFFRFHVSGDIPDTVYFAHMIDVAEKNPHCEILCFTKKYEIVNQHLDLGGKIPSNLHIISFSEIP